MWQSVATTWLIVNKAALAFMEDNAPQMGAALAFYATLSLAPLIIVSLTVAAIFADSSSVESVLLNEVEPIVGAEGGKAVKEILKHSRRPQSIQLATVVSLATLLIGASAVFGQLQSAMNAIWDVPTAVSSGYWGIVRGRLLSIAMVLGVSALLLGSLVLSTVATAIQHQTGEWWTASKSLWPMLSEAVVFSVTVLLFALVFKFVPETRVAWRDVWLGALITAILFWAGKRLIGWYLTTMALGSAYGAAGSLVVLLVWIYYSSQIFFFGAELTYAFAVHRQALRQKKSVARH